MSEILKDDFLEFREIISKNGQIDQGNGAKNIWLSSQNENFGYKIFYTHWMGPLNFFWKNDIKKKTIDEERRFKINLSSGITTFIDKNQISPYNLYTFFDMLNKLYEHDLHPQPIEIFTYKSISGIKIIKADLCPEDRYNNRKNEINYDFLFEILGDHANHLKDIGRHNYGLIDDKIMLIDYDSHELQVYLEHNKLI